MTNYIGSRNTKKKKRKKEKGRQSAKKNTYKAVHYNLMKCRRWEMK